MQTIRHTAVLLDRNALWLEAVEQVLRRADIATVGKTTSPSVALDLIGKLSPDAFVTGVTMADGEVDGIACVRRALERCPRVRPIVLSMRDEPELIRDAFRAGAVAYVLKTSHPDDLASTVRQLFSHSVFHAAAPVEQEQTVPDGNGFGAADLTKREREILQLVAEGHSNAQLARMLWVTEQTVKFHLSNVYRKLDVANRTEAARWAQLHGLLPVRGATKLTAA
jgi:DNA-binding NarL/FixJ family response regulator